MASIIAQQVIDGASGPLESKLGDKGKVPSKGTRLAVGLNPVMPQNAAGIRIDPPVSVPMAATAMPSATLTPAPDEEPPGMRPVSLSHGARGVP